MSAEFGQYVRMVREGRGWSQVQLATLAGLVPSHISRIESGERNPKVDTVDTLAGLMGIDTDTMRQVAYGYCDDTPAIRRLRAAMALPLLDDGDAARAEDAISALAGLIESYAGHGR